MARMDLISGSLEGRVGGIVGQKYKSRNTIRTTSNHIVHIGQKQRKACRAFERLNRISGTIAKHLFRYMGLHKRDMLPHNQVAQLLKVTLENNTFNPYKLGDIFTQDANITITRFTADYATGQVQVELSTTEELQNEPKVHCLVMIFSELGHNLYSKILAEQTLDIDFLYPIEKGLEHYLVTLIVDNREPKPIFRGFTITETQALPVVDNGILYFSRMRNVQAQYIEPHKALANGRGISYNNNTLVYEELP